MTDHARELDALEQLVTSAGWLLVKQRLEQEWGRSGERYCSLLENMANTQDREKAADDIQRVIWLRKELEGFLRWFEDRHAQLKAGRHPAELSPSRRGVL